MSTSPTVKALEGNYVGFAFSGSGDTRGASAAFSDLEEAQLLGPTCFGWGKRLLTGVPLTHQGLVL